MAIGDTTFAVLGDWGSASGQTRRKAKETIQVTANSRSPRASSFRCLTNLVINSITDSWERLGPPERGNGAERTPDLAMRASRVPLSFVINERQCFLFGSGKLLVSEPWSLSLIPIPYSKQGYYLGDPDSSSLFLSRLPLLVLTDKS